MNFETIERAIDKLEALRDGCWPGEWVYVDEEIRTNEGFSLFMHHLHDRIEGNIFADLCGTQPCAQAELVVTLHRTVEPQIALLRLALEYGELDAGSGSRFIAAAFDLAESILKEEM